MEWKIDSIVEEQYKTKSKMILIKDSFKEMNFGLWDA
jgi:hypothetical protein